MFYTFCLRFRGLGVGTKIASKPQCSLVLDAINTLLDYQYTTLFVIKNRHKGLLNTGICLKIRMCIYIFCVFIFDNFFVVENF